MPGIDPGSLRWKAKVLAMSQSDLEEKAYIKCRLNYKSSMKHEHLNFEFSCIDFEFSCILPPKYMTQMAPLSHFNH